MIDEEFNHYAKRVDIDEALINGGSIRAVCGEEFEPTLRVGSSGRADDPDLEICGQCQHILDRMTEEWEQNQRADQIDAELREMLAEPRCEVAA